MPGRSSSKPWPKFTGSSEPYEIRSIRREDVEQTIALWQKCFRHSSAPASAGVRQYFIEVMLDNPWFDRQLAPLVLVHRGEIAGFQGRIARPMLLDKAPVRAVIATQLMVDPDRRLGFAALDLLRALLDGPQDLCYSDGANERSLQMWERVGGDASRLFSFEWVRRLRPATALARTVGRHHGYRHLGKLMLPPARVLDVAGGLLLPQAWRTPPRICQCSEATPAEILPLLQANTAMTRLRPQYTAESLAWLLEKAGESRAFGWLRCAIARDGDDQPLGWFIYYVRPGSTAYLMQAGATPFNQRTLIAALLRDAYEHGAASITGQLDPQFTNVMSQSRCLFYCWDYGVLMHSRNPDLLDAMHRGDAALSRLDGEWWIRLGIDRHLQW